MFKTYPTSDDFRAQFGYSDTLPTFIISCTKVSSERRNFCHISCSTRCWCYPMVNSGGLTYFNVSLAQHLRGRRAEFHLSCRESSCSPPTVSGLLTCYTPRQTGGRPEADRPRGAMLEAAQECQGLGGWCGPKVNKGPIACRQVIRPCSCSAWSLGHLPGAKTSISACLGHPAASHN